MTFTLEDAGKLIEELLHVADDAATAATKKHATLAGLGAMFLARAAQSTLSAHLLARHGLNGDAMSGIFVGKRGLRRRASNPRPGG